MVTRGNVAIYCYNALTAKTWDVTESTDGKLTSSSRETTTILEKYFSDFVNEAGDMKLVEGARVIASGANTTTIGQNQIKLQSAGIATFIDAENAPKRGEEEVTYNAEEAVTIGTGDAAKTYYDYIVVAYVPAEVANIANLAGRNVDVIFGRDNEVAYIAVTDDSYEGMLVTAFEENTTIDKSEIEIDGEAYEIASTAPVCVFGHKIGTGATAIKSVVGSYLNGKKATTRNIVAEFTLNGKDEIESINFKMSIDGFTKTDVEKSKDFIINEFVVEKISAKNVITKVGNSFKNDLDDYEELEPRVIKNGEIAEVADIQVGDVVTEVIFDNTKVEVMIVTSNSVEGALTDYASKTNVFDIDGTEYKVIAAPFYNVDGEIDEYLTKDADKFMDDFEDEEITAYLNFAGEVVAVVGESEATGAILGIVTEVEATTDEDSDDVEYLKVRILAENGTNKTYKIYNKKSGKDISEAAEYDVIKTLAGLGTVAAEKITAVKNAETALATELAKTNPDEATVTTLKGNLATAQIALATAEEEAAAVGTMVKFSANDDRIIKSDDIEIVTKTVDTNGVKNTYDFKSVSDVTVIEVAANKLSANIDDKKLVDSTSGTVTYRFSSSTLILDPATKEVISWEAFTHKAEDTNNDQTADAYTNNLGTSNGNIYLFVDNAKVVYIVAAVAEYNYGASDEQYGILVDTRRAKDEDDNTIYMATLYVDGEEVEYECDSDFRNSFNEGDFVSFKVSDEEIVTEKTTMLVSLDICEYLADLTADTMDISKLTTLPEKSLTSLKKITVDSVEVLDGVTYLVFEDASVGTVDLAPGYIVYDLEAGEMADEICEGDYVLYTDLDEDEGYEIVIVL